MIAKLTKYCIGLLCLLDLVCFAQADRFKIESYTTEEGLSYNYVSSIEQDNSGFIWVGTHRGLNRFDGFSFKTFIKDIKDSNSIISVHIECLELDKSGNLWVGTLNGLDYFNVKKEHFQHISEMPIFRTLKDKDIKVLKLGLDGKLWIGTYGNGLYCLDPIKLELKEFSTLKGGLSSNYIVSLFQENKDILWIGTSEGGLNKLNLLNNSIKVFNSYNLKPGSIGISINSIAKDKDNNLLLSTWLDGLCKFDIKQEKISKLSLLPNNSQKLDNTPIISTIIDKDSIYWITTFNNGMLVYEPKTGIVYNFNNNAIQPYDIKSNITWKIFEDKFGTIWVGTYGAGLLKIVKNNSRFKHILNSNGLLKNNGLSNLYVTSICESSNKSIWIGTAGGGLNKFNKATNKYEYFLPKKGEANSISNNIIHAIYEDKNQNLWIGTDGGVNVYNPVTKQFKFINLNKFVKNPDKNLKYINVYSICSDEAGNLWFGTFDTGVFYYNTSTSEAKQYINIPNDNKSLSDNVAWSIFRDKYNNIWIGTRNALNKYDAVHENFKRYTPDTTNIHSISHQVISCIYEDINQNLWVATLEGGINRYRRNSDDFERITVNEGLPDNTVLGILDDTNGNIWVSTAKGLSKINTKTLYTSTYDKNSGLSGNSYNMGACMRTRSGELYFGGNNGLNVFNPTDIKDFKEKPDILISAFQRFNKTVPIGKNSDKRIILSENINDIKELKLKYDDYVISFEFSCSDYAYPQSIRYAYKMEGFDKEWVYTDANRRYAHYTNLSPGKYTFLVKASNHNGIWNTTGKKIKVIITPPFWQTSWFLILSIIAILASIYLFIWFRIRYYHNQREVLRKLVETQTIEIVNQNYILENKNKELSYQKEEIIAQKDEIEIMNLRIIEADEKKIKFFTNISHEFRTPLTLILGPIESLLSERFTEDGIKEQLQIVNKNANRLLRLINEILDFSKLDTASMKVQLTEGDIVKFVNDIVDAFKVHSQQQEISLSFKKNKDHFLLLFDSNKIEIILYNLISNAFKFSKSKGNIEISLLIEEEQRNYTLSVKDSGIGIDANKLQNVFDRYYQIESGQILQQGSGIGLALTKELIELMKGEISVSSLIGKSTEFIIKLPIIERDQMPNEDNFELKDATDLHLNNFLLTQYLTTSTIKSVEIHNVIAKDFKVLVVDDNEELRKFIKSCLINKYTVLEANNGKEGILVAKNEFPHLIISDIMMPEMDGITFCSIIKKDISTSHIPIILLTANTTKESQLEGYAIGADDYITKPFSKEILLARIQNLIKIRLELRKIFETKIVFEPKEVSVTSVDEKFLVDVIEIIEKNLDKPEFGAAELVSELGMSRTLVHMKFKELTGMSTGEFLKLFRLKRACQLLKQHKFRISEISFMIGFPDPLYFSKIFKIQYGLSPSEYADQ